MKLIMLAAVVKAASLVLWLRMLAINADGHTVWHSVVWWGWSGKIGKVGEMGKVVRENVLLSVVCRVMDTK